MKQYKSVQMKQHYPIKLILISICWLFIVQLRAQVVKPNATQINELESFIEERIAADKIPGLSIGIAQEGELIYTKAFGYSDLEHQVPVNLHTVFEIGSVSKQFTATAIMLLVEQGKLKLDDPIQMHISNLPGEWFGITIHHLLTHTSGIPDYEAIEGYYNYRNRYTPEEIIQSAHSLPVDFKPGEGFFYSNTGYFLLSLIIEKTSGLSFEDFLNQEIIDPLNMTETGVTDPIKIIPNRAEGYYLSKGELKNTDASNLSSTLGAGGIISSMTDLVKWENALNNNKIIDKASQDKMWTKGILNNGNETSYGYAWSLGTYKGQKRQSHSGQMHGFVTHVIRLPDYDYVLILLTNRYQIGLGDIIDEAMQTFIPSFK
jgi:CubicO group peptidase (beta-lactamase class C family)